MDISSLNIILIGLIVIVAVFLFFGSCSSSSEESYGPPDIGVLFRGKANTKSKSKKAPKASKVKASKAKKVSTKGQSQPTQYGPPPTPTYHTQIQHPVGGYGNRRSYQVAGDAY